MLCMHNASRVFRFFGAFNDSILKNFYDSFHKFLTESTVQLLAENGFLVQQSLDSGRTLANAPPAITFLMTTYLPMLQDYRIVTLLHTYCPRSPIKSWPTDIPPPGILALLFDDSQEARSWAQKQCTLCDVAPIPMENFLSAHTTILKSVADAIASSRLLGDSFGQGYEVSFLQDYAVIWTSFTTLLRFVPIELFRSSRSFDLDVRRIVVGHLHDTGNRQLFHSLRPVQVLTYPLYIHTYRATTYSPIDFIDVLKSFIIVLRRMGPDAWQDEGPEYAHVVFNSIKDNTRYADILCNLSFPVPKDDWRLKWIDVYANTVGKLPVFKDILPTILHFLCEQLQHTRFKAVRPNAMGIASKVSASVAFSRTLLSNQSSRSSCSLSYRRKTRTVPHDRTALWIS